ncbi:MAG: hypothetical protein GXO21_08745 [Aquificae bacterium]|nr:hypothetical protein [Aquificota bacterium]
MLAKVFKILVFYIVFILIISCGNSPQTFSQEYSKKGEEGTDSTIDYRQEMRNFIISISTYAKQVNPNFIIIPQNGVELITINGEPEGEIVVPYVKAIDGQGQEDLFYGFEEDNKPTPVEETKWLISFLDRLKKYDKQKTILVIDYCSDKEKIYNSYKKNEEKGYISIATCRELNCIPKYPSEPFNKNYKSIEFLFQAKNFLYLINPENFKTKEEFLKTLENTYYDILIIDAFFEDKLLTKKDINRLKTKPNGAKRIIIAYMSIGEAEDYRYYWQKEWYENPPEWLEKENPDWRGNYKVKYWHPQWQNIIFGTPDSYLDKILNSGFDGVYLDIIDGYEYFEENYHT